MRSGAIVMDQRDNTRRFHISDLMVLVLAIAVGLTWLEIFIHSEKGGEIYPMEEEGPWVMHAVEIGAWWVMAFSHILAVVSIALFLLRFIGPRPRLRAIARQPGTIACGAVSLAVVTEWLFKLNYFVYWSLESQIIKINMFMYMDIIVSGNREFLAVATAWLVLAMGRAWRRAPDWIDRAGLILGLYWLTVPPVTLLIEISGALARHFG